MQPEIVAEEVVGTFEGADNGAGPMWCFASPTIVRDGSQVFASLWEVGKHVKPLCNTRWQLFCREDGGAWDRVQVSSDFNEREPCPLLRLPGGRILLSVNPATALRHEGEDGRNGYFCQPQLLELDGADPHAPPAVLQPKWDRDYEFTEHSYRGCAADRRTGDVLLLNQVADPQGTGHSMAWSFRDADGKWSARGLLRFPIRGCYPHVALRSRSAYVMAVSDIIEPVEEWQAFKREVTGRKWDYEFRQLFFTWTPDITARDFSPVLTFASRDETAGLLRNSDMWIGPDGDVHLIYTDRNVWHDFMRDRYWPELPITVALKYCRIRESAVVERRVLLECTEDMGAGCKGEGEVVWPASSLRVDNAALHATPDERLFVLYHATGGPATGDYLMQLWPSTDAPAVRLPLRHPLSHFFTASERMGTEPSNAMDLYGLGSEPGTMRYAQVRL